MKFECIINEGAQNPRFIGELSDFAGKNNCALDANLTTARLKGELSNDTFKRLMILLDAHKKLAKTYINRRSR